MKNSKKEETKYWNDITGKCRIYAKENEIVDKKTKKKKTIIDFSTSIGVKDENENWSNFYYKVVFKKDEAPGVEGTAIGTILIESGFITFREYVNKQGNTVQVPVIFVSDYSIEEEFE